jgi:hypothetical protein
MIIKEEIMKKKLILLFMLFFIQNTLTSAFYHTDSDCKKNHPNSTCKQVCHGMDWGCFYYPE